MRLFFAVALPDAVRERLAGLVSELKEKVPDAPVGWVVSGNVHLTLRFLGDVDDATLPRLVAAGEEAARAAAPLELELAGVGTFGGRASPRVIWIGITEGDGLASLKKIAEGLEGSARALGFEAEERPFAAHATLGRVREKAARTRKHGRPTGGEGRGPLWKLADLLEKKREFSAGRFSIDHFVLYESRLHGGSPPEYVEAASFPLAARPGERSEPR